MINTKLVIIILFLLLPLPLLALDKLPPTAAKARALVEAGNYKEARKVLDTGLKANPLDDELHLLLGLLLLETKDYLGADAHLKDAANLNPRHAKRIGALWEKMGREAAAAGRVEQAAGFYSKAVSHDKTLGKKLGGELLAKLSRAEDRNFRARLVNRITPWVGAGEAARATAEYETGRLGVPRAIALDNPGWSLVANLKEGDEVHYLSTAPVRQKDNGALRILPAATAAPVTLKLDKSDLAEKESTPFSLARHDGPATVYVWIFPAEEK